ncbi:MAG TPA: peptide-methionine (S)-S-oxide reductase MsrA [Phycisphaerae bacterium]|nr:peptide-methionine (S)-S-oxide reductase MsrA [Phycisphaerae bacterium]HOJ75516.1 peptide-methionine (S)-S-oxide reductase MsrA [Phycisphaerae bacterium]HOM52848.1 peptide-methionine (S)-S-oxide reductase MsrA [Phycisphaerae bacterium]HON68848.1 peptide-methionine (S)-S-oxide reductase MsrA [Phycisphaerae bacterium]HPP27963.1 peptide-methionine (S)-S-oxide reductase MsrA [Phycisphaerae bacterium]
MKSTTQAGLEPAGQKVPANPFQERQRATFAAGCFWGVEAVFRKIPGVTETTVGYTGGRTDNPTYEDVCSGLTGHAEAVEVVYDPAKLTYEDLLNVFWQCHDPTQYNRQGPDIGSQYRSAIFFHNQEQETAARAAKEALERSGRYERAIVTEIAPASTFHKAEDYHQQYLEKTGQASCHLNT